MAPVRLVAILLLCVSVPLTAAAQGLATSYRELALLARPGDTVTLTDTAGQTVSGTITELSPASLALMVDGRPRQWRESDVATISQRKADSLLNGTLIGLAVGAAAGAVGLAVTLASDTYDEDLSPSQLTAIAVVPAGIGAGIGLGIDAAISRQRVIFERRGAPPVTLQVAPQLGPVRAGARLTLGF